MEESDGDEEYAAFPEQHAFVVPEGCHCKDVRNTTENIGAAIVKSMNGIERANPQIHGIFSSFDEADWTNKTKLTDERLKDLIEHMSTKRLRKGYYYARECQCSVCGKESSIENRICTCCGAIMDLPEPKERSDFA